MFGAKIGVFEDAESDFDTIFALNHFEGEGILKSVEHAALLRVSKTESNP